MRTEGSDDEGRRLPQSAHYDDPAKPLLENNGLHQVTHGAEGKERRKGQIPTEARVEVVVGVARVSRDVTVPVRHGRGAGRRGRRGECPGRSQTWCRRSHTGYVNGRLVGSSCEELAATRSRLLSFASQSPCGVSVHCTYTTALHASRRRRGDGVHGCNRLCVNSEAHRHVHTQQRV